MENLITWNTQGEGPNIAQKLQSLTAAITSYSPVIVLLQDAGTGVNNQYIDLLRNSGFEVYDVTAGAGEGYRLITAVNSDEMTVTSNLGRIPYPSSFQDDAGVRRPLVIKASYAGGELSIYNFYNITDQHKSFHELHSLYNYIYGDIAEGVIVVGDFNINLAWGSVGVDAFVGKRNSLDYVTCRNIALGTLHHIDTLSDHELVVCGIDI